MHNIEYFTYGEKVDRNNVQYKLDSYVAHEDWQEGCSGLYHPIRWLDNLEIFADYDEAQRAIDARDRKNYDNLAVRYYEPKPFTDKKYEELRKRMSEASLAYSKKENAIWADGLTSEYIGCKACGSRIRRKFICSNRCPVCREDLRPETTKKAVDSAEKTFEKAQEALNRYKRDHAKKEVKWLVKIEYHT